MSQALDEMFHSHVPANLPSRLQRKRLQWLSLESQGPSRAPPDPTCIPPQYLSPVWDLWDPLLRASALSRAWAVPRMIHTVHPCFRQGKTCHGLSCIPARSSLLETAVGHITEHGALHEPPSGAWILGLGAGSASASGAPLKSTELCSCGQSCSSALGKLCSLQPGEQLVLCGALPIFL